jgi:chemotaxis protein histidine kinase CheA
MFAGDATRVDDDHIDNEQDHTDDEQDYAPPYMLPIKAMGALLLSFEKQLVHMAAKLKDMAARLKEKLVHVDGRLDNLERLSLEEKLVHLDGRLDNLERLSAEMKAHVDGRLDDLERFVWQFRADVTTMDEEQMRALELLDSQFRMLSVGMSSTQKRDAVLKSCIYAMAKRYQDVKHKPTSVLFGLWKLHVSDTKKQLQADVKQLSTLMHKLHEKLFWRRMLESWNLNFSDDKKRMQAEVQRLNTLMHELREKLFWRRMLESWNLNFSDDKKRMQAEVQRLKTLMHELREKQLKWHMQGMLESWNTATFHATDDALKKSTVFRAIFKAMHEENLDELKAFATLCKEFPQYSKKHISLALNTVLRHPPQGWKDGLSRDLSEEAVEQRVRNISNEASEL